VRGGDGGTDGQQQQQQQQQEQQEEQGQQQDERAAACPAVEDRLLFSNDIAVHTNIPHIARAAAGAGIPYQVLCSRA
jgi:hypothetical protein